MEKIKGAERKFNSAEEMLEAIVNGEDFYNPNTCNYVFVYNDCGSIAVYGLYIDEALDLQKRTEEYEEGEMYWGAFLGPGGSIYDDESYEDWTEDQPTNLDFCKETFADDGWICVN